MEDLSLLQLIKQDLGVDIPPDRMAEARFILAQHFTELINTDLHRLYALLYRIDISEKKLKQVLKDNPEADASLIIADLVLERQLGKIETRRAFRKPAKDIDENESW